MVFHLEEPKKHAIYTEKLFYFFFFKAKKNNLTYFCLYVLKNFISEDLVHDENFQKDYKLCRINELL